MNDDPFDANERAQRLATWVDRAHDACEKGGQDAVAPLIDELDDLDKSMVLHGLIVSRVADRERLGRANHLLSTAGMDPQ